MADQHAEDVLTALADDLYALADSDPSNWAIWGNQALGVTKARQALRKLQEYPLSTALADARRRHSDGGDHDHR